MGIEAKILKSDTLAIGKDSNGIRVRSSCLGFHEGEERNQEEDGATVKRILTTPERNRSWQEEQPERKQQHGKHTTSTWHDAQTSMMHVRFKYAWHGKVHKQHYKLSGAQYATSCILTKHHINCLVLSVMYPTMLNVVNHVKRWSKRKLRILGNLNAAGTTNNNFRKILMSII